MATFWCGAANSMLSLIFARAICGLGAGGMLTMSSILMSDLVPIEERGMYQSYINILFGVGATTGAATGGAIADSLGWRVSVSFRYAGVEAKMRDESWPNFWIVGILYSDSSHNSLLARWLYHHTFRHWHRRRHETQDHP